MTAIAGVSTESIGVTSPCYLQYFLELVILVFAVAAFCFSELNIICLFANVLLSTHILCFMLAVKSVMYMYSLVLSNISFSGMINGKFCLHICILSA